MGFAKQMQMEAEDRGWWSIDGYVCAECVGEDFLAGYVDANATQTRCDFCRRESAEPIAADADEIMTLIGTGVYNEWTHPLHVMGRDEGEWVGETYEVEDVLWDVDLVASEAFRVQVANAFIDDLWCRSDPYALEPHEALTHGWERFADHVTYCTRYVFLLEREDTKYPDRDEIHPGTMLKRLEQVIQATGIVRRVIEGTRFTRARDHKRDESPVSARELGTPPREAAKKPNRMSPAGIPLFYGAGDAETAVAEMAHSTKPLVTLAEFATACDLQVVDLSRIPDVPSLFDETRAHHRAAFRFLTDFATAISQPIAGDGREHVDYVPTQVVTDFVRRVFRDITGAPVDGLLYRSSRHEGGECCVLFVENDQCVEMDDDRRDAVLKIDRSSCKTVSLRSSE